jgi:hypothetical protein
MTTRLIYTGQVSISFMGVNAELSPGDEFNVSDDQAASFLQRPDIEAATDRSMAEPEDLVSEPTPEPVAKTKKAAQSEPAAS